MTDLRRFPAALLLACAVTTLIAQAEPMAGSMMDQKGMMGQERMMDGGNDSGQAGMMGRGSMMQSMMHACMSNRTCMTTMMQSMMNACMSNQSCMMMMPPAAGASAANQTGPAAGAAPNASSDQARLECARFWLEKAVELHDLHLRDPTTTTNESQMELMDQIKRAYECVTGENATMEMANETAVSASPGDEHGHQPARNDL